MKETKKQRIARLRLRRLVVMTMLIYYEEHSEKDSYTFSNVELDHIDKLQDELCLIDVELGYIQGIKIL